MKEDLQSRPKLHGATLSATSATFGAAKITQLENQIKFCKTREDEQKTRIVDLQNELELLEKKLQQSEQQRNANLTDQGTYTSKLIFVRTLTLKKSSRQASYYKSISLVVCVLKA